MTLGDMTTSRRTILVGGLTTFAITAVDGSGWAKGRDYPFTLGVASGDPLHDRVILWTRLAPQPLAPDGGMAGPVDVRWEVAEDLAFARVVRSGSTRAELRWGHSVHVDAAGLRPGRQYFYRFLAGGEASPVGRTRTAPPPGAMPDRLRICFGSCQKYEVGHYGAYRHIVADDPDIVLFLGDYIYEDPVKADEQTVRPLPMTGPEPVDLAGYRLRYAAYKLDPLLQAAHQATPWVLTWDDHEVSNDYGGARDQNNSDPAFVLRRRAAAYQAYREHQPVRAAPPVAGAMRLYRALDWGRLAQLQVVDDRQYRDPPACQPPGAAARHEKYRALIEACPELADPRRTLLGSRQEAWLARQLGTTRATWNILAQQTLMRQQGRSDPAHPERGDQVSADTWSGYPAARARLVRRWAEARTPNPIALGGDIHAFAAADLPHPDRPDAPPVASEYVGGAITSLLHDASFKGLAAKNGLGFAEDSMRGYGRVDLTPKGGSVVFRGLSDSRDPASPVSNIGRFALEPGRPGLQRA